MNKRLVLQIMLVMTFVLFVVSGVSAQDAETAYPIIDPSAAVATIINAVYGLVMGAFGAAPVTVVIVSLLKRIPALDRYTVPALTFSTASVLYVLAIFANRYGIEIQFNSFLDAVAVVAPAILSFITTLIGAPKIYNVAHANEVTLIGKSRYQIRAGVE